MSIDILKALTTSESSGADLIPERLDPILVEEANVLLPLRELLPRVKWSTNAFEWNARTALPVSGFYNETDTFSDDESTYERRTVTIKMIKSEGMVSQLLQDTSKDYINALQAEINAATRSLVQREEWALINGNTSTSSDQYAGLRQLCTTTFDAEGDEISLDLLDQGIKSIMDNNGKPSLIILSNRDGLRINQIMRGNMTYNWNIVETRAGTKLVAYGDIPIITSTYMPSTLSYGATPTSDHSDILILDTSQIVVPWVRDVSFENVATSTDGTAFRLKLYEALAVKSAIVQCKIENVGSPS